VARDLQGKELWTLQQEWRTVFGRRLHRLTGMWASGRDRDMFRQKVMLKYLTGAPAQAEYANAAATSVYVVDEDGERAELRDEKPPLTEFIEKRGVVIFPPDFAWAAAVGPDYFDPVCFTYREWVDDDKALDAENVP
jgi:hypothetical protein